MPLGWLVRGVHRWSALLLQALVVLHVARVLLMRAYRFPRDVNWWLGLGLLVLVFIFGATGYLLRWDVKAFTLMLLVKENLQAVPAIGEALVLLVLGGTELGVVPLFRGYAFHIWFLPLVLALLLGAHLLVAWRQGAMQETDPALQTLRFLPGLLVLVAVMILAALLPTEEPVTGPTDTSPIPHPDWLFVFYFLPFWFFQGSRRAIGSVVIPAMLLLVLASLPLLPVPKRRTVAGVAFSAAVLLWTVWLFGQTGQMGAQVPAQGCRACHKATIVGDAPTRVSEFEARGPEWLVGHLQDPPRSLIEPFRPSETQ